MKIQVKNPLRTSLLAVIVLMSRMIGRSAHQNTLLREVALPVTGGTTLYTWVQSS
jgi:hypothetical protein